MKIETEEFIIHKMQIQINSYELNYIASDIKNFEYRIKNMVAQEIVKQLIDNLEITGEPSLNNSGVTYKAKIATLKNK